MDTPSTTSHPRSRIRFPLYLKILLWFFLNVLSLLLIVYLVLGARLGASLDAVLMGAAGERLRSVSRVIGRDLRESPPGEWDAVLRKFSESYQVSFGIFGPDVRQIAGEPMVLPAELRPILARARRRPKDDRALPAKRGERPAPPMVPGGPLFMKRAGNPKAYWVGIPMAPRGSGKGRGRDRDAFATLVVRSETLSGNGLLLDVRPWLWTGAGAFVFSLLFWLPLVRGITRSIRQMTNATGRVASGDFEIAVDENRNDELGQLGSSINRMTTRLQGFVTNQRRFLGDISHELCTPIARTRMALGALEVRTPPEQRGYLRDADEEMEQMSAMVNELLSFSKASLMREETRLVPVALRPLVTSVVEREAPGAGVVIDLSDDASALAEPGLLARALANVLRNAVRYAAAAGPIRITATERADEIALTVADSGPGVPPETLPHLFDPFFRPEIARTRESGGSGLGLAIVKTCVEACRGNVAARNGPGGGFEVTITLSNARGS